MIFTFEEIVGKNIAEKLGNIIIPSGKDIMPDASTFAQIELSLYQLRVDNISKSILKQRTNT